MKIKSQVKKWTDLTILVLMPLLAAEPLLGQKSHEWMGIGMSALLLLHHVLNYRWFRGIFQGKYSPVRVFITALNLLLLADFLVLAYSGARMSGFVLKGLHLPGRMRTARILHLFASEWGLILMSVHTGVHSGLHGRSSFAEKKQNRTVALKRPVAERKRGRIIAIVAGAISVLGAYAFIDLKMLNYLFLRTHFILMDESKSLGIYLAEVLCMMLFFGMTGHLMTGLLKQAGPKQTKNDL